MPQRTLGFKIFRNFLYSPNKTRMGKGHAEIRNRLKRELADCGSTNWCFWRKKRQLVSSPSSLWCLRLGEGVVCPESIKHNLLPPRVEMSPHGAKSVFQKPVTFQEEIIVFVRCCLCPVLNLLPNRNWQIKQDKKSHWNIRMLGSNRQLTSYHVFCAAHNGFRISKVVKGLGPNVKSVFWVSYGSFMEQLLCQALSWVPWTPGACPKPLHRGCLEHRVVQTPSP